MISSFKQYLVEETKSVYFTWGRMNPPTIGHEKLLNKLVSMAGSNPYRIYLTQSVDPKKNPLKYQYKIKTVRKMFPRYARSVMLDKKIKTIFDAMVTLYKEGFKNVCLVVGSDRIREFDILLKKYNGKKSNHGFYNFENIYVKSAGQRDPDAEGAEGMSASKMRKAATDGDFTAFSQGIPKTISNKDSKVLYNNLRSSMGLKEQKFFKRHVQLDMVSEEREKYIRGYSFKENDEVIIKETGEIAKILVCGSNYVIVEVNDLKFRKWLKDIEKIEEAPQYYTGVHRQSAGTSGAMSTTRARGLANVATTLGKHQKTTSVQRVRKKSLRRKNTSTALDKFRRKQRQTSFVQ